MNGHFFANDCVCVRLFALSADNLGANAPQPFPDAFLLAA